MPQQYVDWLKKQELVTPKRNEDRVTESQRVIQKYLVRYKKPEQPPPPRGGHGEQDGDGIVQRYLDKQRAEPALYDFQKRAREKNQEETSFIKSYLKK